MLLDSVGDNRKKFRELNCTIAFAQPETVELYRNVANRYERVKDSALAWLWREYEEQVNRKRND